MASVDSSPDEVYHDPLQSPLNPAQPSALDSTPVQETSASSFPAKQEPVSGLSQDDFHRIQLQLLELRTLNCQLGEENKRLKYQQSSLEEKLKSATGSSQKLSIGLSKMIPKSMKKGEEGAEEEVQFLRRKLNSQEEEFRLQQSTLREELNRVMEESEAMETKLAQASATAGIPDEKSSKGSLERRLQKLDSHVQELKTENSRLIMELDSVRKEAAECSKKQKEDLEGCTAEAERLKTELATIKGADEQLAALIKEKESLQQQNETQKWENGESIKNLKQEIVALQEKFRRKQESYVQLNREKESQYQEYRKSLDGMVEKKDSEINGLVKEINDLKNQLKVVDEFEEKENWWKAEGASLQEAVNAAKASYGEVRDQNEVLQIQLQETHSANDCLSAQLQEARQDVLKMQEKTDSALETAEKRKQLLDEMAQHLEEAKENQTLALRASVQKYESKQAELEERLLAASNSATEKLELEKKVNSLETQNKALSLQLTEASNKLETAEGKIKEAMESLDRENKSREEELERVKVAHSLEKISLEDDCKQKLEQANKANDTHDKIVAKLYQDLADKDEQIKLIERKQSAVMRDLKRQVQSEKRRADRLQEKIQDLKAELTRNKSPGFEEIKASEIETIGQPSSLQKNPETGSISSWSVLSGNNRKGPADRDGDNESTSSATLDQEIQELISRITTLQKDKSELEERVNMLEDSSSAMAEDLMKKSAIIEHYVKDKTVINPPSIPGSPSYSDKLKRVMDMVKVDQSASDIREMNKRLQLMLEEALTKNMHMEKNLELLTKDSQ